MTVEPKIYLDSNGVTIKCTHNCPIGFKQLLNGIEYEVIDNFLIRKRKDEGVDMTKLCTSLVTDMSFLFSKTSFNQPIGNWDVSGVEDMNHMFCNSKFNQPIGEWDVSNVLNMSFMFNNTPFNQEISKWDVNRMERKIEFLKTQTVSAFKSKYDITEVLVIRSKTTGKLFFDADGITGEVSKGFKQNSHISIVRDEYDEEFFLLHGRGEIIPEHEEFSTDSPLTYENKPQWGRFQIENFSLKDFKNLSQSKGIDFDNVEFQNAVNLIQETNQSFFLTGKAGTGKSTFLKHIVETVSKNFVVVAPTGIAAVNANGVTIHSFFRFPLRPLLPEDNEIKIFFEHSEKRKIISAMDTLIIDEISMVRADLIDGIDFSLRKNGGNPNLPFGGKQIIFVGDLFQLEPVALKKTGEWKIINEIYGSTYFYKAKVFERLNLFTVELKKVYRQTDPSFISLLDKVRVKEISQSDIDKINTRVIQGDFLNKKEFAITLTSTNVLAENVNNSKLNELKTTLFKYNAEVSGEFEESKFPTEPELKLKLDAQVIFIKNDTEKRWVNGTIGKVSELKENEIKVKLKDGSIHSVEKRIWENLKYTFNREKKVIEQESIGTFEQYPLKLAWAITIHKSQGLTFDSTVIDFGNGTFASGQAYVALSRATKFGGLFLKQKMLLSDIFINDEVKKFARKFSDTELIDFKLKEGKHLKLIFETGDLDALGKYYLSVANSLILEKDFSNVYYYILKGFDYVICDCIIGSWIKEGLISSLNSTKEFNCSISEMDLIFAYSNWLGNNLELALKYINVFIQKNKDAEIGYYIKARIYSEMKRYDDALDYYYRSLKIKETSRALYRIGRTKEQYLNKNGIFELYKASLPNVTGHCTAHLAEYSVKRGIILSIDNSFFSNIFNEGGMMFFHFGEIKESIFFDENGEEKNFKEEKRRFLNILIKNKEKFLSEIN